MRIAEGLACGSQVEEKVEGDLVECIVVQVEYVVSSSANVDRKF